MVGVCSAEMIVIHRRAVARHNLQSGEQITRAASDFSVETMDAGAVGPDGHIYVTGNNLGEGSILKFDGATGAFRSVFVAEGDTDMTTPVALRFGPDVDIYVASMVFSPTFAGRVYRFDGKTGAAKGKFIPENSGPLTRPVDMAFGADRALYVLDMQAGVLKFDGENGAYRGVFAAGDQPAPAPQRIAFSPEGELYWLGGDIRRFSQSGELIGVFVNGGSAGLDNPVGIAVGPEGDVYVAEAQSLRVKRFAAGTGASKGVFVDGTPNLSDGLMALAFSIPHLTVSKTFDGAAVEWPSMYTNYTLVSRTAAVGTAAWNPVSPQPTAGNGRLRVELGVGGESQVFRLRAH